MSYLLAKYLNLSKNFLKRMNMTLITAEKVGRTEMNIIIFFLILIKYLFMYLLSMWFNHIDSQDLSLGPPFTGQVP